MVDLKTLNGIVDRSGISKTHLAQLCGCSRTSLYDKLEGKYSFKAEDVAVFKEIFHLTMKQVDEIFLN